MRNLKKLLSCVIVFCMIFTVLPLNSFAATAIEIGTAEELRKIGRDSAYKLSGNYVLTADIDVSAEEWVPIGLDSLTDTTADDFTGTIDGNGHVIKGMWNEDRTDPENPVFRTIASKHWGFIAKMKSGTIKNLAFSDIYFNIGKSGNNEVYIAGVVGYLGAGKVTINNVAVLSGKIDATNFAHRLNMAGIATSYGHASSSYHTIKNCYNAAELHAFSTVHSKYSSYASVAGILMSAYYDNARNTVENCLNVGKIYLGSNATSTWQNFAGNIVSRREEKVNTAICKAVLNNNYAVDSLLNISYGTQMATDAEKTNIVYAVDAGKAESYSGLTSVTDSDGNAIWTVTDGKYPMLTSFASYAQDAVVTNYTLIETLEELQKIGVDEAYPMNGYYMLANDIDASEVVWTPIGNDGTTRKSFTGLFEGNGKKIIGLNTGKDEAYTHALSGWGLFYAINGVVRNLGLEDIYFNTISTEKVKYTALTNKIETEVSGGIAAYINCGKILNCAVDGTIINTQTKVAKTGGIVGATTGAYTIDNCFIDVDVTVGYAAGISSSYYMGAGGILGSAENSGIISNVLSIGSIDVETVGYVGAIAGQYLGDLLPANIVNAYSTGDINYWVNDNRKAYNVSGNDYTKVTVYGMLNGSETITLPETDWTVGATNLIPYLNVFAVPAVSDQTSEIAADAIVTEITNSRITNYTTADDIKALAETVFEVGDLAVTIDNFTLTAATTSVEGNLIVDFTVGEAVRNLTLSIEKLPLFNYDFSTRYVGLADGVVTVTDANYAGKAYRLYWGDDNGVLQNFNALATLSDFVVTDETNGVMTYTAIKHSLIPEKATKLYLSINEDLITEFAIPTERILTSATPNYTFAEVSDTHLGDIRSTSAYTKVLQKMQSIGGKFVNISGDITDRGNTTAYNYLKNVMNQFPEIPTWVTLGNHDILIANRADGLTEAEALANVKSAINGFANPDHSLGEEYVVTVPDETEKRVHTNEDGTTYTMDMDYAMSYGDDLFIYLGIGDLYNSSTTTNYDVALSDEQLAWLDKKLDTYYNVDKKQGQAFLVFHYFTIESGLNLESGLTNYKQYAESSKALYDILEKYPAIHFSGHNHYSFRTNRNISVNEKHTAINTPSLSQGFLAYEGYLVERYEGYTLIKGYNFLTDEYIPNAMFYVAEEYNEIACNPVTVSTLGKSNINSTNGTKLTYAQTNVYDNRLIPYSQKVYTITATAGNGYSGAYAFATKSLTADENYRNELYGWKANNGDLRFYIKNDSEESLTFQPYIYAYSKYVDGTNHKYVQGVATKEITVSANSGWVEVRIPANGFTSKGNFSYFGKGNVDALRIGLYTTAANGFLNNKGGKVYVSRFEFHDHTIASPVTTDFDRPYTEWSVTGANYSWKVDNTGNIARSFVDCTDLPFITKATKFTASETYDYSALASSTQLGLFLKYENLNKNLENWALNPNAQLRFWIKSTKDTTFIMTIQISTGNAYATVDVNGKEGWQEVVLYSSDFTNVSNIYDKATSMTKSDFYVSMTVKTGTFTAGQEIMFANRIEAYSDKLYSKGDANRDGEVNLKDLVKVKKLAAADAGEFINCDIDADGKLASTDVTYFRKWMLYNNWSGKVETTEEEKAIKILFTGNSHTFYGRAVEERYRTNLNISTRRNDKGIFAQLCKEKGMNVEVTNWTWPNHGLGKIFSESCTDSLCEGVNHLSYLTDRSYDYVVIQEGTGSKDSFEDAYKAMEIFKEANPNTKFVYLEQRTAHLNDYARLSLLKQLAADGVIVVDWGDLVDDLITGETVVPGATQEYNKNSFIVSQSESDGFHPNMLTGYITSLMTYSAITGEKAEGQPYAFCDDSTINSIFDLDAYNKKYYTYSSSNFVDIFGSESDMLGIQQLIDKYLEEKPYMNFE